MNIKTNFERYQAAGFVHPLTCRCGKADMRYQTHLTDTLILVCPVCSWQQVIWQGSDLWELLAMFDPAVDPHLAEMYRVFHSEDSNATP